MKANQRFGIREFASARRTRTSFDSFILAGAKAALGILQLVLRRLTLSRGTGIGSWNN